MRPSRAITALRRDFMNASAEVFIPSPLEFARETIRAVRAHIKHVQAEQIAFQQRLDAIGVARLSRMSTREVIQQYGCD